MFITCGKIDADILREIGENRLSVYQKAVLFAVFAGGIVWACAGFLSEDMVSFLFGCLMAFSGAYALFYRPKKWMEIQKKALEANGADHLTYTVSYGENGVRVRCETNGYAGTVPYKDFVKGIETEDLLVLFTFRQEYAVTFKKQLGEYQSEKLIAFLSGKLPGKFRWNRKKKKQKAQ